MTNVTQNFGKEFIDEIITPDLLDSLFGFAYKRSFSRDEAQDLCQEIIVQVLQAFKRNSEVENIEAYIWQIAHNTYSNYVKQQKKRQAFTKKGYLQNEYQEDGFEEDVLARLLNHQQLDKTKHEIAFLGKIYRGVMVLFYIEELPISEIAKRLNIPENRVKQRLFSAREKIRKEVRGMETNALKLKPNGLALFGTGDFSDSNGIGSLVNRLLAHNILIACRTTAKSSEEIARELEIPSVFIEDELRSLENGGVLIQKANGKYLTDFIILDLDIYMEIHIKHYELAGELRDIVARYVTENTEKIMGIDYLVPPESFEFALWTLIPLIADQYQHEIIKIVLERLSDILVTNSKQREWTFLGCHINYDEAIKISADEAPNPMMDRLSNEVWEEYGMDGGMVPEYDKYKNIRLNNFYGARLPKRYSHPSDIYRNPILLLVIRCIDGLAFGSLSEKEKEIAAKALEQKLIKKVNNTLYPNMLVFSKKSFKEFSAIKQGISDLVQPLVERMADWYIKMMKTHLPAHLYTQAYYFVRLTGNMQNWLTEECIRDGLLYVPDKEKCGEGMWLIVEEVISS